MERERFEHELLEYVEGRLDPAREAAVREAMSHDPAVRARVVGMQKDREQLMREPMEERAPGGGVERAISQAERDALVEARSTRRRGPSRAAKLGALAAMLVLATLASLWAWQFANNSVKQSTARVQLPEPDPPMSPLEENVDPDEVVFEGDIAAAIEEIADLPGQSGLASELEFAKPIEAAAAAVREPEKEMMSIEALAGFDNEPVLTMGPELEPAIGDEQLARAVELAGLGRLVIVVDLDSVWEGEVEAWETLAAAGGWDAELIERDEAWHPWMSGANFADEALPGEKAKAALPGVGADMRAVFEQDAQERILIEFDETNGVSIEETVIALGECAHEMGGVVEIHDRGEASAEPGDSSSAEEPERVMNRIEVLIRWAAE